MAGARRDMNGVKPTFDNLERSPLLDQVRVEISRSGRAFKVQLTFGFVRGVLRGVSGLHHVIVWSEANAASRRHDSPDP